MQNTKELKDHIYNLNKSFFQIPDIKSKRLGVSRILSSVKIPFDKEGQAEKCAAKNHIEGYKYFGMSKAQILEQWNSKNAKACKTGSSLDDWAQYRLSGKPLPIVEKASELEMKCIQFDKFKKDLLDSKGFETVGTEMWISSEQITAKLDAMFKYNSKLIVFDWKQNETISVTNSYGKSLIGPMSGFEETESVLYTLQVQLYKYLLETTYGMDIASSRFVHFTTKSYKVFPEAFNYSKTLIEEIISHARTLNNLAA